MPRRWLFVLVSVAAALPLGWWLRGFMVDDALISARYAHHIATGVGHRFNPGGPITDGVTPLGFAWLLAPLARGGVLDGFHAAKALGLVAWLGGCAAMGATLARTHGRWPTVVAMALLASSAPLAAWASAGMETGLVLGMASMAACAKVVGRDRASALVAGLIAGWRPECAPWAMVLALGPTAGAARTARDRWLAFGLAIGPSIAVALARVALFGRAMPLALVAKPSDWAHGWRYALACALLCGTPAMLAWRGTSSWLRGMQLAVVAQLVAIAVAGGDWMPLSRLMVAVLPTQLLVAAFALDQRRSWWAAPRVALALAGQLWVCWSVGPRAATVGVKRLAVIEQLAPTLAAVGPVASLDIGWVGAATRQPVVDLAGVTDPGIAVLPGGHTSKRIPPSLLQRRQVALVVLLLRRGEARGDPWQHSRFARWVEAHVAQLGPMQDFEPVAESRGDLRYLVVQRRPR
jgi:hypothetical protein